MAPNRFPGHPNRLWHHPNTMQTVGTVDSTVVERRHRSPASHCRLSSVREAEATRWPTLAIGLVGELALALRRAARVVLTAAVKDRRRGSCAGDRGCIGCEFPETRAPSVPQPDGTRRTASLQALRGPGHHWVTLRHQEHAPAVDNGVYRLRARAGRPAALRARPAAKALGRARAPLQGGARLPETVGPRACRDPYARHGRAPTAPIRRVAVARRAFGSLLPALPLIVRSSGPVASVRSLLALRRRGVRPRAISSEANACHCVVQRPGVSTS
jgi:hypothetical protein